METTDTPHPPPKRPQSKQPYASPKLVTYGSVRNLTGGSGGRRGDGGVNMNRR